MFLVCQTAFRLYFLFFFFTPTPTTDIYTLSLHDALPIFEPVSVDEAFVDLTGTEGLFGSALDAVRAIKRRIREETCLTARSEEHTSELQSHHDLVCRLLLEKKKKKKKQLRTL